MRRTYPFFSTHQTSDVRVVDPRLYDDRTDGIHDNNCVVVYGGDSLDECVLNHSQDRFLQATDLHTYTVVPGKEIISVALVTFDGVCTLAAVRGDEHECHALTLSGFRGAGEV